MKQEPINVKAQPSNAYGSNNLSNNYNSITNNNNGTPSFMQSPGINKNKTRSGFGMVAQMSFKMNKLPENNVGFGSPPIQEQGNAIKQ